MICPTNPCQNGGVCDENLPNPTYKCDCPPKFTGDNCEFGELLHYTVAAVRHAQS